MLQHKLHYAKLLLDEEIPCFEFSLQETMIKFIIDKCKGRNNQLVWLIAKNKSTDIFISSNYLSIIDFLKTKNEYQSYDDYFLQEYESFEDAYEVALDMAEISPLCYKKKKQ